LAQNLKSKLRSGQLCLGAWITLNSTTVPDILKNLGYDWFVFDTEHSALSLETVSSLIQVLGDKVNPLVRVGAIDQWAIKLSLDIGAQGVVIPLVNTLEEAERAVKFCKYPPQGIRGVAGGKSANYGMNSKEYLRSANEQTVVIVQIETRQALNNLDDILSVDGIDVAFVGPSDLTMSLGYIDDRANPGVIEAMEKVARVCEKHGKVAGIMASSVVEAKNAEKRGFRFISLASDIKYLMLGANTFLKFRESS
jgi:2-keto-3-deoxy-L-rhamnonate aldolase RhmA